MDEAEFIDPAVWHYDSEKCSHIRKPVDGTSFEIVKNLDGTYKPLVSFCGTDPDYKLPASPTLDEAKRDAWQYYNKRLRTAPEVELPPARQSPPDPDI